MPDARIDLLSVQTVLQVDLEVPDRQLGTWGVQLAWAVVTSDARQVHELDVGGYGLTRRGRGDGLLGFGVDGAVPHGALEGVGGVLLEEALEAFL